MDEIKKRLDKLSADFFEVVEKTDIRQKQQDLTSLEQEISNPEIWNNPEFATKKNKEFSKLQSIVAPWTTLETQIQDLADFMELGDDEMAAEFEGQLRAMEKSFANLRKNLLFNGQYDTFDVIMRITAGVGGTDAQDFAEMLERMYLRFCEKNNFKTNLIERSSGEEAGIKTSVIEIEGAYAFGNLQSENGAHRLVRLSPFNSDNLRQTSFALVEILPKIDEPGQVEIADKDLKIDVYRSGGHGGQSVNTTDSAVRVTHLPTGITVAIQNERSQLQNKETALALLQSKLAQMQLEQHADKISDLRAGESANWGSQIRNYVLHPYSLVKDTRTKYEEKDPKAVLDGKIDGFISAFLEWKFKK